MGVKKEVLATMATLKMNVRAARVVRKAMRWSQLVTAESYLATSVVAISDEQSGLCGEQFGGGAEWSTSGDGSACIATP